ncbi:MAG TPA: LapA family protein [Candidatus Deferrimicrobium sp.]
MKAVLLVLVVLLAFVAAFAVQNPGVIVVRFLTFSGYTSLLVVIVAAFAAGVVSAGLAGLPGHFRRRSEAGAASRRIRELEAEVGVLKGKPGGPTPPAPAVFP